MPGPPKANHTGGVATGAVDGFGRLHHPRLGAGDGALFHATTLAGDELTQAADELALDELAVGDENRTVGLARSGRWR